jgi:hypothetical protein
MHTLWNLWAASVSANFSSYLSEGMVSSPELLNLLKPHALIHKRNTRTVVTCGGCEPCGLLHDCGSIPRTDLDLSVFRTFGESWLFANAMVVSWHSWKAIEFTVSETLSAEAIELTVTAALSACPCMAWPTMDLWLASASRTCMR